MNAIAELMENLQTVDAEGNVQAHVDALQELSGAFAGYPEAEAIVELWTEMNRGGLHYTLPAVMVRRLLKLLDKVLKAIGRTREDFADDDDVAINGVRSALGSFAIKKALGPAPITFRPCRSMVKA